MSLLNAGRTSTTGEQGFPADTFLHEASSGPASAVREPVAVDKAVPLIAHIVYRLDVGGLETVLLDVIHRTSPARFRHVIVCLTESTEFRNRLARKDVEIHALGKKPGKDFPVYFRLFRLLRKLRPAIVQTYNIGTLDAVLPAVLAGVPVRIHAEHGRDARDPFGRMWRYRVLRRLLQPFVRKYIAVSEDLKQWLLNDVGIRPNKVELIYNGIDPERYRAGESSIDVPDLQTFAPPGTVLFGTVGRLDAVKDHLTLVQAFRLLLSTLPAGEGSCLRLMIVGDGPQRPALERAVQASGVQSQIWLAGARDDVPQLLRKLDVFVISSIAEGVALTVLEAMATCLPVVATRVGGNPELVLPGRTGALVPARDPRALALSLKFYLEHPELRALHGRTARERIQEQFAAQRMADRYGALYAAVAPVPRGVH